ncbi:MAG: TIR domain-containing protein [Endomicrobium sp.]|jgi:hypothetical protein|nr:TIR domain-containing protein [Endomicrobium sp.]
MSFYTNIKRRVFYSFHYEKDVMRASQIRNIGIIEGNSPVSDNDWEEVKRGGDMAIKRWIDNNMNGCSCLIVLIGEETANRKWVRYEIEKAWNDGKGVMGIHIHNIKCPRQGRSRQGKNPFLDFYLGSSNKISTDFFLGQQLSNIVPCHNPYLSDAYNDIKDNLNSWVNSAIQIRERY